MLRPRGSTLAALLWLMAANAVELPSCEADIEAYCVGESQDLSSSGIAKCLESLDGRSDRCSNYLALMTSCETDIGAGGVCENAVREGEAVPCLVQRMKPEQLSAACAAALPKDNKKGLAKFWAEGKRVLLIDELAELSADEKDTYNGWKKRKGAVRTDKDKERQYAIKTQKKVQAVKQVTAAVAERLKSGELTEERAQKLASREAKTAVQEDMTGTLKAFTKGELASIAKEALTLARATKNEL